MRMHRQASNDNTPAEGVQPATTTRAAGRRSACRVVLAMAEPLPVLDAEVALVEAYLSDVISAIIANDN